MLKRMYNGKLNGLLLYKLIFYTLLSTKYHNNNEYGYLIIYYLYNLIEHKRSVNRLYLLLNTFSSWIFFFCKSYF